MVAGNVAGLVGMQMCCEAIFVDDHAHWHESTNVVDRRKGRNLLELTIKLDSIENANDN